MSTVRLHNVTAAFGKRPVLDDLSLTVPSGGSLAVIGPNGAGKSTLLNAIAGLVAYHGEISVGTTPMRAMARSTRARLVALVPQSPLFPAGMTVFDYVLLGRTPHIPYWRSEGAADVAITRMSIKALDLSDLEDRSVDTLSGGERQRAVLARALTQEPEVLLLDEPTTGLDLGHQQTFLELVESIRHERGTTVISAIHDLTVAARCAAEMVLLSGGVVAATGSPATVITEDLVRRHYGAAVEVIATSGGPVVVPLVDQTTPSTTEPTK